jgi:hypothetical protein
VGKALWFAQKIWEDFMHDRREMMVPAAMGGLIAELAFAADPVMPAATVAERQNAPVMPRKVDKPDNLRPALMEPNDMQFAANGDLWILDQKDPNKVFTGSGVNGVYTQRIVPAPQ